MRGWVGVVAVALVALAATLAASGVHAPAGAAARAWKRPAVRHVFVVNLENKDFGETFGAGSPAVYLNQTLLPKGQLLDNYYGTAHNSLPNYIAQLSGQGPNPQTHGDCQI